MRRSGALLWWNDRGFANGLDAEIGTSLASLSQQRCAGLNWCPLQFAIGVLCDFAKWAERRALRLAPNTPQSEGQKGNSRDSAIVGGAQGGCRSDRSDPVSTPAVSPFGEKRGRTRQEVGRLTGRYVSSLLSAAR